jgi:hypothetical protein
MKHFLFHILWASQLIAAPLDEPSQAAAVNARLSSFHGTPPEVKSERKLRIAYFLPTDRKPAIQYRERLTRVLTETADFYEKEMARHGVHARRLPLDLEADGLVRCIIIHGTDNWTAYNSKDFKVGSRIREECLPGLKAAGIEPEHETIALFTAIMEWDEPQRRFRQRSPYQGGGSARSGFCWQIDAPVLDPALLSEKSPIIDDGEYGKVSLGKWNSLFVGGVIHELGHAFGLPHNAQSPDQYARLGLSLMGAGNRTYGDEKRAEGKGSFLAFADALRLASHPLFSGSDKGLMEEKNDADVHDLRIEAASNTPYLKVRGRVTSSVPVYAVLAYVDPEGGGDYDATTATAVPDADGRFELLCDALPKNGRVELRLAALQVNGMVTTQSGLSFSMNAQGQPELEELRQRLVLMPVLAQLRIGRAAEAAKLSAALPDSEPAKQLAAPMLSPPDQRAEKSEAKTISLCDLRPASATVGWRKPAFDYSPEDLIITVGGQIIRRAVYAHAESRYVWKLDGTWKQLRTRCALHDEENGSVEFIIKLDGVEKWRSGIVLKDKVVPCEMDITGVKSIELIVTNGGDDFNRDHGFWIEPTLSR